MSSWPSRGLPAFGIRGLLWIAVVSVLLLSYLLYSRTPSAHGPEGATDWIFRSWPALFAAGLAMWLLLKGPLATAHSLVQKLCRLAMFFFLYCGVLYVLKWNPFWKWILSLGFGFGAAGLAKNRVPEMKTNRPSLRFTDVGGMENAKQQIREIVENRLHPGKFGKYGVVRNGILLHGPRGSGKTFLAEAAAGEFGLNYHYLSSPALLNMWIGNTGGNIREAFASASHKKPVLLFIDEIDSLGAGRNTGLSPGTGHREYNNITIQLMQSIDQYRSTPGFILMAATNVLDGLDPALIREGRFDAQIRVDMPDESTRRRIFEAQLRQKPWKPCNLDEFARRTPGSERRQNQKHRGPCSRARRAREPAHRRTRFAQSAR